MGKFSKALEAVLGLAKTNPDGAQAVMDEIALLEKAGEGTAAALAKAVGSSANEGGPMVRDLYMGTDMHSHPTREQIAVGEPTAATGAAQRSMNERYSNNAPQKGLEMVAEQMGEMLGTMRGFGKAMTAMATLISEQAKAQNTLIEALTKAEDEEEEADDEPMSEKAKSWFAKAKARLAAAHKASEDMEDAEGDERKACRSKAKRLRKAAAKALVKARLYAGNRKGTVELRKSIDAVIAETPMLKSEVEVVQEEDDDDDDEEKAKAKAQAFTDAVEKAAIEKFEAMKAAAATGGNQAAGQDENDNQPAAQAKAVSDQLQIVTATLQDVMRTVQGLPAGAAAGAIPAGGALRAAPNSFSFLKAEPKVLSEKFQELIETATDAGLLRQNDHDVLASIQSMLPALAKGSISESQFQARVDGGSAIVKSLVGQLQKAAA